LRPSQVQYNAITARKLGTRRSTVGKPRFAANVLRKGITIATVLRLFRNASLVEDLTNRSTETVHANDTMNKF
jgi:hypothetical protein